MRCNTKARRFIDNADRSRKAGVGFTNGETLFIARSLVEPAGSLSWQRPAFSSLFLERLVPQAKTARHHYLSAIYLNFFETGIESINALRDAIMRGDHINAG